VIKRYSNRKNRPHHNKVFVTANHHINFSELRVMDEHGEPLGLMSKAQALQAAEKAEKDLVLVTDKATPPVVKIIDLSKDPQ
jgi:translation initiation factor IF-3